LDSSITVSALAVGGAGFVDDDEATAACSFTFFCRLSDCPVVASIATLFAALFFSS
jgi:hypothetical protein